MAFLKRSFLVRRRIDHWALAVASAAMPIRLGLGPLILFLFSCVGIYLSFARHTAVRLLRRNSIYSFCFMQLGPWGLFCIGEPFNGNRQISYTLLIAAFAFAGPGMLLVRNPLRAYVLGSRVGVLMAVLAVIYVILTQGGV